MGIENDQELEVLCARIYVRGYWYIRCSGD